MTIKTLLHILIAHFMFLWAIDAAVSLLVRRVRKFKDFVDCDFCVVINAT